MACNLQTGSIVSVTTDIVSVLRDATRDWYIQLAELLPSAGKGPDACDYRWTLERLYGFYAAFEREAFKSAALRQLLPDWTERRKEPWLEDDLYWMGYTTSGILRLPLCRTMPSMSSIEALMGGTYVSTNCIKGSW